jgi:hypothetical protein
MEGEVNPQESDSQPDLGLIEDAKAKWLNEGGKDFDGPVGERRKWYVCIPRAVVKEIMENGFPEKDPRNNIKKYLMSDRGTGIYLSNNPKIREFYPGALLEVEVAMGKLYDFRGDNTTRLARLDKNRREGKAVFPRPDLFNKFYKENGIDTAIFTADNVFRCRPQLVKMILGFSRRIDLNYDQV